MTVTLPPWHDSMSDGCSFAPLLSAHPDARACCVRHDERYYYGGSHADRLKADQQFRDRLVTIAGVNRFTAALIYRMVRLGGRPAMRIPGVSWAFGGGVFSYT